MKKIDPEERNELLEQAPKLLSAWEVGLILGLSESTVQQLARDGELVREFIESHTVRAPKPRIPLDLNKALERWGFHPENDNSGHE